MNDPVAAALIPAKSRPTALPGAGDCHFAVAADSTDNSASVRMPAVRSLQSRMDKNSGAHAGTWWFNPRDGKAQLIGEFPNQGQRDFISPNPGEELDWVLVLDDAARNFAPPGAPGRPAK